MIKYKELSESESYVGIQRTGMNFIMLNVEIAILILGGHKKVNYKRFLWIKPITIIFVYMEVYLLLSLIRMDFAFGKENLMLSIICLAILILFGYKWFPCWEKENS